MSPDTSKNNHVKPEGNFVHLRAGLYLVATPIGNLRDISLRALDVLSSVDVIYCEDTRVSGKLLKAYGIKKPLLPYHDHTDEEKRAGVIKKVANGAAVALISDAGMPMVSDPGYKLVRACYEADLYVSSVPGASAPLMGLQLSGLACEAFSFIGFLPSKDKARRDILARWDGVQGSLIAFESAARLIKTLEALEEIYGERDIAVARELTKMYEEVRRGTAGELLAYYEEHGKPKGEIVLVIGPAVQVETNEDDVEEALLKAMESMRVKDAAHYVAQELGVSKKRAYEMALRLKEN